MDNNNTTTQHIRQAIAFAMVDGLKFAGLWCISFFCVFQGVNNGWLSMLGQVAFILTPILGCILAKNFEKQVRVNGPVHYGKAYIYSVLIYVFASTIMALFCLAYFLWIDKGAFADAQIQAINSPEYQEALKSFGITTQMINQGLQAQGFNSLEDYILSITPADMTASLFNTNFFISVILALPTALFARSRK